MPSAIVLLIVCIMLLIILCVSIYFNIKHGLLILKIQDSIEKSLDILDSKYFSLSKILEIPIFFDSVEVRQVVSDIKTARESILSIAHDLTDAVSNINEKGEEDGDKKE